MGTVILVAIVFGIGSYFLFGYIESKRAWTKRPHLRARLTGLFTIVGLIVGVFLIVCLTFLIPPKSYEEKSSNFLSPFMSEKGGVYAVVEKEETVFLRRDRVVRLVRRRSEEIKDDLFFLPEGSTVLPHMVRLEGTRSSFFGKWFLFRVNDYRFFIPSSGIKEGSVRVINTFEFVPLPP